MERSAGWHKLEWVITDAGTTEKIDGKIVSTNPYIGSSMTEEQKQTSVKLENRTNTTSLKELTLLCQWANNATNLAAVQDKQFIDGVSVVKNGAETVEETLRSGTIKLTDVIYTVNPDTFTVDSTYPEDVSFSVTPYMEGESSFTAVSLDGTALTADQWTAAKGTAPDNASNYPEEHLTVKAAAFAGLTAGEHTLALTLANGRVLAVPFTVTASAVHTATDYYLSQNGDDSNDGHSADSPWKTFAKLEEVTFGPGDHIYLDATSTWSGVQFQPKGSGSADAPIVLTKYNDGGDSSLRPILNGDGTVADFTKHSYLAFDAWRAFYPSGTIELFNVENWEVRGIEVTNYEQQLSRGATGRNGIAIIFDYFETQGMTTLPANDAEKEKAFYRAGKLQHVVVEDCYIHDVVGFHPDNGAVGRGGKLSGGINAYGPYDDLQLNNNIIMYCDVEGIRNDILAWKGDTRTQFPAYMENVSISNNYVVGVPGDGVVISSANKPILENNYLTDAGYSYHATTNASTAGSGWSANTISTCKDVTAKTGTTAKPMGVRSNPQIMRGTNFAGLWFIGTKDAVAQYNEAVNNVWICNDAEAFDADMFCWGTIFQYNYTYRNNGGFCLFMGTMDDGTIVRYNISVEDAQSVGISEQQNGTFHYAGTPEAIHNNLFILGDKVATMFGGGSNTAYFYNNIVIAPNGLTENTSFDGYHLNGSSDGTVKNPKLSGEVKNNIFYPAKIVDSIVDGSSVTLADNIVLNSEDEMKALFKDLDSFMDAQPVKALAGRSEFKGSIAVTLTGDKGNGTAMTDAEARKVKTPTGGFDLTVFDGVKLADGSAAIGKGLSADAMHAYSYKAQNDAANPLQQDFYRNNIAGMTAVDIGPHQYSAEKSAPAEKKQIVQEELTADNIPQALKDKGYTTPEKVAEKFKQEVGKKQSADNLEVYDVVLKISYDGGATWVNATAENFPAEGIDVAFDLPADIKTEDAAKYTFVVAHMKDNGEVELMDYRMEDGKLIVHVNSLSPFAISWAVKQQPNPATPTPSPAGGSSQTNNKGNGSQNTVTAQQTTTSASATAKPAPQKTIIPQTGDEQPLVLYMVLAVVGMVGFAGVYLKKKKQ